MKRITPVRGIIDARPAGGREQQVEDGARRPGWLADLPDDVRFTVRGWRRSPGFSVTIVLTLVLGLGLAAAIFAFADGYLFRGLPFPSSDRLFFVRDPDARPALLKASDTIALRASTVGDLGFVEWGGETPVPGFSELLVGDRRVRVRLDGVSPGFAQVMQMPLEAGRVFTAEDYVGATPVPAWISYRFWQHELGGDPDVLGRAMTIDGLGRQSQVMIVGILDRRVTAFDLNNPPPELVLPSIELRNPGPNLLSMPIVRLPEDMSPERARAAIASTLQGLAPAPTGKVRTVRLASVYEYQVAGGRPTAQVFSVGALLILGLVMINLVHLLLTRGVARAGEIATRAALGASRWRIARIFVVEGLLLGILGIAGGLVLGAWLASVIASAIPTFPTGPRNLSLVVMAFDARIVIFAVLLGFAISLSAGVWPTWQALRHPALTSSRNAVGGGTHVSSRNSRTILASEVAVATVIMVGTVFMGLGIWRYLNQPLGFELEDRWNVYLEPPRDGRADDSGLDWTAAVEAVRGAPGVRAAGVRRDRPVRPVALEDRGPIGNEVRAQDVAYGYFEGWGIRPTAGRLFRPEEVAADAPIAIVDEKFATWAWPNDDPIGKVLRAGTGPPREVIGVVPHERRRLSMEIPGVVYVPRPRIDEREAIIAWAPGMGAADLAERVAGPLAQVAPGYRAVVSPITFENIFARDAGEAMFQRPLVVLFGLSALVLAGVGLFGLVSYLVEQRTRDFGIRLALGARPGDIWRPVIGQSVVPAAAGLLIGLGVAWALEGVVRASVFGWKSSGALAMTAVAVALMMVAVVAAIGPARHAMRIDPIEALRAE